MKRKDLIKKLEKNGWFFSRHGSKHDIYTNGTKNEAISRQTEIPEPLGKR
ncbi:MAG: toxin-antitoxin system, toxin component, HicA family protein [Spirochaetes bacterium]|nr:toxin-antitoxin system, toxin component, HicA family protein [Spirochaetota bacterium]